MIGHDKYFQEGLENKIISFKHANLKDLYLIISEIINMQFEDGTEGMSCVTIERQDDGQISIIEEF